MALDSVGNANVNVNDLRNKPEKSSEVLSNAGVGFVSAGVPAYFFVKDPIRAEKVIGLDKDTFEKTFKGIPDDKKAIVDGIKDKVDLSTNMKTTLAEQMKNKFGEGTTLSVEDYLKTYGEGGVTNKEELTKYIESLNAKTQGLTDTHIAAKEVLESADDVGKAEAQAAFDKAAKALTDHNIALENANLDKTLVENAKGGKVARTAVEEVLNGVERKNIINGIEDGLKELGDVAPKMRSLKNAGVYAAIGAVVFGLAELLIGGPKQPEAQKPIEA